MISIISNIFSAVGHKKMIIFVCAAVWVLYWNHIIAILKRSRSCPNCTLCQIAGSQKISIMFFKIS